MPMTEHLTEIKKILDTTAALVFSHEDTNVNCRKGENDSNTYNVDTLDCTYVFGKEKVHKLIAGAAVSLEKSLSFLKENVLSDDNIKDGLRQDIVKLVGDTLGTKGNSEHRNIETFTFYYSEAVVEKYGMINPKFPTGKKIKLNMNAKEALKKFTGLEA